jgi:hypothetical protein
MWLESKDFHSLWVSQETRQDGASSCSYYSRIMMIRQGPLSGEICGIIKFVVFPSPAGYMLFSLLI